MAAQDFRASPGTFVKGGGSSRAVMEMVFESQSWCEENSRHPTWVKGAVRGNFLEKVRFELVCAF